MSAPDTKRLCPECGLELPARGGCPHCLLRLALGDDSEAPETSPPGRPPTGLPSRFFGDYEILDEIARGGMGVVYRARHLSLKRVVALKMIQSGQLLSPEARLRFGMEVAAAAQLNHPHIVPLYESGEFKGAHFFTMRLVEGGDLAQHIQAARREGGAAPLCEAPPLASPEAVASLLIKTARAVHHAHQRGILHRDLKPSNILIDPKGEPHVGDFGLAKMLAREGAATLTESVLGSPNYMAPEQAAGHRDELTTATDVYGLGAILYEALTGQPPFTGNSPLDVLRRVVEQEPVAPWIVRRRRVNPKSDERNPQEIRTPNSESAPAPVTLRQSAFGFPSAFGLRASDLDIICLKCLAKDPARRYATAEALAEDLERWLHHEPVLARPAWVWERAAKWARRHPARAGLVTLAVLAPTITIAVLLVMGAKLARERDTANMQRRRAVSAEQRVSGALASVRASEADLRQNLYSADLSLAFRAAQEGHYGAALRALEAQRPPAGQPDLRGFEWCYLRAQCRGQQQEVWKPGIGSVNSIAFTADGNRLALAGERALGLWDRQQRRFVFRVDHSASGDWKETDASRILTTIRQSDFLPNQVAVLRPTPQQLIRFTHPLHVKDAEFVSVSPDGQRFVAGLTYPRVWETTTGTMLHALPAVGACPVFSSSGLLLAVGSYAGDFDHVGSVKVYDLDTRQEVWALSEAGGRIGISRDGLWMATGSYFNGIRIWNLKQRELLRVIPPPATIMPHQVVAFALSPDGRWVAAAYQTISTVYVWEVATGRLHAEFIGHQGGVSALAFEPTGRHLASGGADESIRLWDLSEHRQAARLAGHTAAITSLAFTPDGNVLASASRDETVRFWPARAVEPPAPFANLATVGDCMNGPRMNIGGRTRLTQHGECLLRLSSTQLALARPEPGAVWRPLEADQPFEPCGFSVSRSHVFALRVDPLDSPKTLLVWDPVQSAKPRVVPLPGSQPILTCQTVSADGRWLAGGQAGATIMVWDTAAGEVRARAKLEPGARLAQVEFSPDGRLLAASSTAAGQVRLFEAGTGRALRDLGEQKPHRGRFSPDSRTLATASRSTRSVQLWDVATGEPLGVFAGHLESINDLAFAPDGKTLASVSSDRTLKLWNVATRREIATLTHGVDFQVVAFSPDGSYLVAFRFHGEPTVWAAPVLAEIDGAREDL